VELSTGQATALWSEASRWRAALPGFVTEPESPQSRITSPTPDCQLHRQKLTMLQLPHAGSCAALLKQQGLTLNFRQHPEAWGDSSRFSSAPIHNADHGSCESHLGHAAWPTASVHIKSGITAMEITLRPPAG